MLFSDGTKPRLEQLAVSASLEFRVNERITLVGAGGALLAGHFAGLDTSPGGVASVGLAGTLLEQGTWNPFVQLSGSIAFSTFAVSQEHYTALDLRAGVVAGWTFFDRLTPYAVFRAFGGPVFYAGATGTDAYHVQLGLGLVVGLPFGFDLSAEFIPLGEQRVTAGLGFSF
ncbi:MAG: hypothetical protein U0228_21855 [Myxococcaceae bacterium]